MEKFIRNILTITTLLFLISIVWASRANIEISRKSEVGSRKSEDVSQQTADLNWELAPPDTNAPDTIKLRYPIQQKEPYQPGSGGDENPLYLRKPKNIKEDVEYDNQSKDYIIKNKIDNFDYTPEDYVPFKDYLDYDVDKSLKNYWKERAEAQTMTGEKGIIPKIKVGGEVFDRIFGGSTIDIRPQGSAELIFGVISNRRDDPALNVKQRRITNFDFQEKIQMNVTAKIGDKINLGVNYNTEASFDFENKMKLAYEGKEDEIIKTIEAGNITLPLTSTLITGSQSLFGFKTKLQFGKIFVTGVFSEQQSKSETINVTGGAQVSNFTLKADQYEEYRHYLMSHYFRDNYEKGLAKLPLITSNIIITKIELWVTNIGAAITDNRNIIALSDLGEEKTNHLNNINKVLVTGKYNYPHNDANNLYAGFMNNSKIRDINTVSTFLTGEGYTGGLDYEKIENARKLNQNEYTFNNKLGFISLNTQLNSDQVLAVAYQYKIIGGSDNTTYQVGEFSDGGIAAPSTLIVKLLKGTSVNTNKPIWDLMMKNVYSIGAYQVNKENFILNILYTDNKIGVPTGFLNETKIKGEPLIKVMGLDRLNMQLDNQPDGVFDFIDGAAMNGGTIQATNGRIYFPVLEPFGRTLRNAIDDKALADKYAYDSLYRMTKVAAQQYPEKNKFSIQGTYKSAGGSEITLNAMNIPQGSVKVTPGGIPLNENVDFTVDYALGRVKIINEGVLNSGTPVQISLESNSLFSIQKKTMMGTRIEYVANKDLNVGSTLLHLTERPLTQKISFGEEPISNTIWGMDVNYQKESNLITKILDKLPFYNTKTASHVQLTGEFANLIPGHSRAIGKSGTSYIDDFEGSTSGIDLKTQGSWKLSGAPEGQSDIFPEAKLSDSLAYGFNRAKLAWYSIDPIFLLNNNQTPTHIRNDKKQQSNHFVREVLETEVFPNKQTPNGQPLTIPTFDLSFYPDERGPYNFDVEPTLLSSGINKDGKLNNPKSRWGGIMRYMTTTDFESTNIEYIQFWMMDPFVYSGKDGQPVHSGGELYFDIGDISEDVLKDGRKSFENGLPTSTDVTNKIDTTKWGIVPTQQALVNSFDNNPDSRKFQDVGLDGLGDAQEETFFRNSYLEKIANDPNLGTGSVAYQNAIKDPSGDDYHYFRGSDFDNSYESILNRYKNYNGMDGNSPTSSQSTESYPTSATNFPDVEDINRDNTLSEDEKYFQYKIDLKPARMNIGENYIADYMDAPVTLKDGNSTKVRWYQFKIPVRDYDKIVGNIQDFKSIRFMRVFFRGFNDEIHCRFATMELIRSEWRKYNYELLTTGEYIPTDLINNTNFTVSSVNIEENGRRKPVPYVIPPGIEREINWGSTNLQQLNEQSLDLKICDLIDGDARAIYKTSEIDVRKYKRFKMFVHEEAQGSPELLKDGDLTAFVRLGTDFTDNYYEYEIPLNVTNWNSTDPSHIWPEQNNFDVELNKLVDAKQERNILLRQANSSITLTKPYIKYDGNNKITVVGLPNLAAVKTIMIGVRNPKKKSLDAKDRDDGLPKCAEIWFDEFRLTDFDEKGGWAATGRVNTNLADLGNLSIAGNISTPNFGGLEQKINDRKKEETKQFDIATNLELGKFLPEKSGIRIPMHFDFSQTTNTPQYSPLNPDVLFKDDLSSYNSQEEKNNLKQQSQDVTKRKNLNFSNIKKVKTGSASSKPHIYDIENFDVTYAYSELTHHDADVEYNIEKKYKVALGYNFVGNPKKISPFARTSFLGKSKTLALIKDFNFYYLPKMLTFQTDFDRQFTENLLRNKTTYDIKIDPTYTKIFNWSRLYGLKYDITQNLKLDYQAQALARIDEPQGAVSRYTRIQKDSLKDKILGFGRINNYNQKLILNYNIPVNKLPFLDWVTANATYNGEYHWTASPLSIQEEVGNTIENGNNKQLNANANFANLYNKIPYLKNIFQSDKERKTKTNPNARYKNEGIPKTSQKSKPKRQKSKGKNGKNGKKGEETDSTTTQPINYLKEALKLGARLVTSVKTVSFSYSEINGTLIPGFKPLPVALGQDWNLMSPGTGFVFGSQQDIRNSAFSKGWISGDSLVNTPYLTKSSQNLTFRGTLEPLPDFRVEITATRNKSSNVSSYLKYDSLYLRDGKPSNGRYYDEFSRIETGNFTMSYLTWNTAFIKDNKDYSSKTFRIFQSYLIEVAKRLASENKNWKGKYVKDSLSGKLYPDGYGPTSQSVLLPAFLAAYTKRNPSKTTEMFPSIPFPNWRVTYTGLSKIEFLKRYFESVTIGHAYQSTYSVGNYTTNALFVQNKDIRDVLGNIIPEQDIGQVTITEQFSPLLNIDLVWVNSLMSKLEIKKSRSLALSFANNQLTEIKSSEIVFGLGYRIKDVVFYVKGLSGGSKKKKLQSDINLKADVSIRNNKTVLRKVVENFDQISAGQQVISINTSADYQLSERFQVRVFFDKIITNPFVSSQFPNSNTNGGISLRFTLAQ